MVCSDAGFTGEVLYVFFLYSQSMVGNDHSVSLFPKRSVKKEFPKNTKIPSKTKAQAAAAQQQYLKNGAAYSPAALSGSPVNTDPYVAAQQGYYDAHVGVVGAHAGAPLSHAHGAHAGAHGAGAQHVAHASAGHAAASHVGAGSHYHAAYQQRHGVDNEINHNSDCIVGVQHAHGHGGAKGLGKEGNKETAEKEGNKQTESTIAASAERPEWASWSGKNNRTVPRFVRRLDYCAEVEGFFFHHWENRNEGSGNKFQKSLKSNRQNSSNASLLMKKCYSRV